MKQQLRKGFKLRQGPALEAVRDIVANTYRNITGAIEFLLLKGYEQFKKEQNIINGCDSIDALEKNGDCRNDNTCSNGKCDGGAK
jgi:hypothetical protein